MFHPCVARPAPRAAYADVMRHRAAKNEKKAALACRLFLHEAHGDRPLRHDDVQRDIMFMLTLCITHSVPTIRIAAVSTV